jgi:N-acetylmuramoyl-L-alanine amidase
MLLPERCGPATDARGRTAQDSTRWRTIISRDALSVSFGATAETFSNIKTPAAAIRAAAPKFEISTSVSRGSRAAAGTLKAAYKTRYLAHIGLLAAAAFLVAGSNPDKAHSVSVRLMSAQAGIGGTLDEAAVASVAADMADKSQLLVASSASKTATTKSEQVALLTTDDDALAKRQVVSTAGNATRDITQYAVQPGDTLSGIAGKFDITTSTLKWANGLDDADMVKPGQSLTILPVSGLLYTVRDGDTADSLASAYQANAAQILSYNNAEVKGLTPCTKIIIPDGVKQEAPKPAPKASTYGQVAGATTSRPTLTRYYGGANGYSFGYCTYYVASRRSVPSNWGNANAWYYNAQASGFSVGSTPVPGAIAWTGAGYFGHVAYVEGVSGGMVTVSEMNYNGNWDRVTTRTVPAYNFKYIY